MESESKNCGGESKYFQQFVAAPEGVCEIRTGETREAAMQVLNLEETDKTIAMLDEALKRHVYPLVSRIDNSEARNSIAECVRIWEENKNNPMRNAYKARTEFASSGCKTFLDYVVKVVIEHPAWFFVSNKPEEAKWPKNAKAMCYNEIRLLAIPRKESYDLMDALRVIHELTHIKLQTAYLRPHLGNGKDEFLKHYKKYVEPFRTPEGSASVIEHEFEAIGNEMELLKVLFGLRSDKTTIHAKDLPLTDKLNRNDLAPLDAQMGLMTYYFPDRRRKGEYPQGFCEEIEKLYRRAGVSILTLDKNGLPVARNADR